MVYFMENPMKMDDQWANHPFFLRKPSCFEVRIYDHMEICIYTVLYIHI